MCELLALSSRSPTRVTFSLAALAARSGPGSSNRDGWGAAFYQNRDVALMREPRAANDSPCVQFLESHGPPTTLAISHIRRATTGAIALENTQPFMRELGGAVHVFAHNGHLSGIAQVESLRFGRYRPIGQTDSEHAFCALLERMAPLWQAGIQPEFAQRLAVVKEFAAQLRRLGPANFLYADGDVLFAHGHRRIQPKSGTIEPPGLHVLVRQCAVDHDIALGQGIAVEATAQQITLIASVPLSTEPWRALAEGEVIAVSDGTLR